MAPHDKCYKMCRCDERLDDKVTLITGANTGIGIETVRDFLKRGATVVMACRSQAKMDAAVEMLKEEGLAEKLETLILDLNDLDSVRKAAEEFKQRHSKLHVLVNNAGIMALPERTLTAQGYESQIGVNHLAHFLLTNLLIPTLKASAPARIIAVSSSAHTFGFKDGIMFDDLMGEKNYGAWTTYGQSKLANVLMTNELSRRLKDSGVTANALHPGAVKTELVRNLNWFYAAMISIPRMLFFKTPLQGAQTQIHLAVCAHLAETNGTDTGLYYDNVVPVTPVSYALDEEMAKKLWKVSLPLVGLPEEE